MDSFDFIQCEEDSGYEAYQAQQELEQYLESDEFREELNKELAILAQIEKELNAVDFVA
jgi:hypothetical protein